MNRMSLYGILILHVKHSWSVSPVIPDLAYKVAQYSSYLLIGITGETLSRFG